ncbi:melibiose:sodium transporter MelB [Blautia sp.]|uniref:melibiose:sodium transporter MelB n=1 Tax=Blautia sp. TaxID=1955243 RepID=UPI0025C5286A|nr:melibiose:sodium transporter MelB [Blautia sp.]
MDSQNTQTVQYKHVSAKEKYCFGIGAIGKDAICNLVGAFLMLYFTDTLYLSPAFVGVLFFVARIWDAINDPMMGMIVDNTRTKYGKFRIWITVGTLVNSVFFILLFHSFHLSGTALYVYVAVMYILYGMTYTIMDVPYWSWLPNLTNDPREREKVSVIPRFFASLAGFSVSTFGLYIINYFNKAAGEKNPYAETGYTLFAIAIVAVFIITIGITVCNVKESSTIGTNSEKTSLKQAFHLIVKNDQLLAFIGLLLTFNLCTQIAKSFAVYYFKNVCGNEYLYSIFGFAIIAEMMGLMLFPMIAAKISREKVYSIACSLPVAGFLLLGAAGYIAPQNPILVVLCCVLLFFGSGLSLGVTTCCMADVIDYGEVKFGVRNESITCSAQTFLMKAAMAAAGGLTGVGLQIVGYDATAATQSAGTITGIRVLMILIPVILAIISLIIYKKCYKLKGAKLEEVTKQINELHQQQ